jgi:hypothetical protein
MVGFAKTLMGLAGWTAGQTVSKRRTKEDKGVRNRFRSENNPDTVFFHEMAVNQAKAPYPSAREDDTFLVHGRGQGGRFLQIVFV